MTDSLTQTCIVRRAFLAAAAVCALAGPAAAESMPSRDYPPTYSSRKAPWYDPLGLMGSADKKAATPAQPVTSNPVATERFPLPPGSISTPAWKWYGYGTPTPGQNPLAPSGTYAGVPGNWYGSSGATPGAVPHGHAGPVFGVVPDPYPSAFPGHHSFGADQAAPAAVPPGPALPNVATRTTVAPPADVNWQSVPARLRTPINESMAISDDGPRATLRPPVPVDETPVSLPSRPDHPVAPPAESPDLPIEPAPGIVPPTGSAMSRAGGSTIARGLAPAIDVPAAVRRACGRDARVMEIAAAGPKRMIVRLAATSEAALATRDRLARTPELAGWRIEFELVTPLSR